LASLASGGCEPPGRTQGRAGGVNPPVEQPGGLHPPLAPVCGGYTPRSPARTQPRSPLFVSISTASHITPRRPCRNTDPGTESVRSSIPRSTAVTGARSYCGQQEFCPVGSFLSLSVVFYLAGPDLVDAVGRATIVFRFADEFYTSSFRTENSREGLPIRPSRSYVCKHPTQREPGTGAKGDLSIGCPYGKSTR